MIPEESRLVAWDRGHPIFTHHDWKSFHIILKERLYIYIHIQVHVNPQFWMVYYWLYHI